MSVLELADEIDLAGVPVCAMCLFDLAWEIHQGRKPSSALVARTVEWVWLESGEAVRAAVERARREERPFADEALRELDAAGWGGRFAEAVVWRLARRLVEDMEGADSRLLA
jgi:uroporphyrinogen-III synthase